MSTRTSTFFYGVLIALASLVAGMVLASRLDLAPRSAAAPLGVPAANSAPLTGPLDAGTFRTIARDASPSVVTIKITATRPARSLGDLFGLGDQFGGRNRGRGAPAPPDELEQGAGSGFIIDTAGHILTNNHVVADADTIEVHLASMSDQDPWLAAKLIGRDQLTDSALIQLSALPKEPLSVARFGDSAQIAAGDWVEAIGNPLQMANTVTVGVVSFVGRSTPELRPALQRDLEYIQTDAAINRGNSGGPLLNIRGEVIGINTMILSELSGGNIGIGFAVPINLVLEVLPQLREGKVVRGRIGVSVQRTTWTKEDAEDYGLPAGSGALVVTVVPDSPARAAGIKLDDVIVEYDGKPVKDDKNLVSMVTHTTPGTTVPVKVIRAKKPVTINVKIEELDLEKEQQQTSTTPQPPRAPAAAPKDAAFGMKIQDIPAGMARSLGLSAGQTGAVVMSVDPRGPASQAGLAEGDVIASVNGRQTSNADQVSAALDLVPPGRLARLVVIRKGAEQLVQVRKR
jgi:serine protease Do